MLKMARRLMRPHLFQLVLTVQQLQIHGRLDAGLPCLGCIACPGLVIWAAQACQTPLYVFR